MSTAIEVRPEVEVDENGNPTGKETTFVRLDDDFRATIRIEVPDKDSPSTILKSDYQVDFTGLPDGEQIEATQVHTAVRAPIAYVRLPDKIGTDSRCIIAVRCFHRENEAHRVPASGIYWYNPQTQYAFGAPAEAGKTEAANPLFEGTAQTFPTTIFSTTDVTARGALPAATATRPVSFTAQTLYARLGNLAARRAYLKSKIRENLEHPNLPLWLAGNTLNLRLFQIVEDLTGDAQTLTIENELPRRVQAFSYWLEMLARAVSIDANLDTAAKFDKLDTACGYSGGDIIGKTALDNFGPRLAGSSDRTSWNFLTLNASWAATRDNTITLSPVPAAVTEDWMAWVRA